CCATPPGIELRCCVTTSGNFRVFRNGKTPGPWRPAMSPDWSRRRISRTPGSLNGSRDVSRGSSRVKATAQRWLSKSVRARKRSLPWRKKSLASGPWHSRRFTQSPSPVILPGEGKNTKFEARNPKQSKNQKTQVSKPDRRRDSAVRQTAAPIAAASFELLLSFRVEGNANLLRGAFSPV